MGYSMYDPYHDRIEFLLSHGLTVGQTYREIFKGKDGYTFTNFQWYCRTRNLFQNKKYSNGRPNCRECKNCGSIKHYFENYQDVLYCKLENTQINPKTKTCPTWCPIFKEVMRYESKIG